MHTAVMDDIVRQRDAALREAVRAGLAGEVKTAFAKLGDRVMQVERVDLGVETALHWLNLPSRERDSTGVIAPLRPPSMPSRARRWIGFSRRCPPGTQT